MLSAMNCFFYRSRKQPRWRFSWGCSSSSSTVIKQPPPEPNTRSEPCLPLSREEQASSDRLSGGCTDLRAFSYSELRVATKNFSRDNLVGEGGFGSVYRGSIKFEDPDDGQVLKEVAIKQLNKAGQQGHKEWLTEVHFLGLVKHPSLVKLLGYCAEDDDRGIQRLLVYEYMPNRSLEQHLFRNGPTILTWDQRLHILVGVARGLAYLHEEISGTQIIFRDFKTSNVLLDMEFLPKLSDFGMAREGPNFGASHVSTAVVGTMGYVAPEYLHTGHLTAKSDVWSFGIVLVEMLTGRRVIDTNYPKNEQYLLQWAKPGLHGDPRIHKIMDPRLEGDYSSVQAQNIALLALRCLEKQPKMRPPMSIVVKKLEEVVRLKDVDGNMLASPSGGKYVVNAIKSRDIGISNRRKSLFKDVMSLKNKEDAQEMWRVWTPKAVST